MNGTTSQFRLAAMLRLSPAILCIALFLGQSAQSHAQESEIDEEIVTLDPFSVSADDSRGYQASATLAGTRINTSLRDIASTISVVTKQFLEDTGAKNLEDLLIYTAGTEVAGVGGNFAGPGGQAGRATVDASYSNLRSTTRVRGLASADITRNYFSSTIPFEAYNTERVEINRGANSVLYGLGSPAGIINSSLLKPNFNDGGEVRAQYGSFGSIRGSIDVEKVLVEDILSVRVAGVIDHRNFQQDPAFRDTERYYGVAEYRPTSSTTIRISGETGTIDANSPRILPPMDAITDWFNPEPVILSAQGLTNLGPKIPRNPAWGWPRWETGEVLGWLWNHRQGVWNPRLFINDPSQSGVIRSNNVGGIDGFQTGVHPNITGRGLTQWRIAPNLSGNAFTARARGHITPAEAGFFLQGVIKDRSVFDFKNKLLDGPNKKEFMEIDTFDASVSQLFFDGNAGFEVAHHNEYVKNGREGLLRDGGQGYNISVALNTHMLFDFDQENPNFGRPTTDSASGTWSNSVNELEETRFTPFVKTDLREYGILGKILGQQTFTGLLSTSEQNIRDRSGKSNVWGLRVAELQDNLVGSRNVTGPFRDVGTAIFLGPSLKDASSAKGANISNLQEPIQIESQYLIGVWNRSLGEFVNETIDVEKNVPINGSLSRLKIDSKVLVLQNRFYNNLLVGTYGWREDKVKEWQNNVVPRSSTDNRALLGKSDFFLPSNPTTITKPRNTTWGLVGNVPQSILDMFPWKMDLSLFYGKSENSTVGAVNRDVLGNVFQTPSGETEEIGISGSILNNKISFRIGRYETVQTDEPIPALFGLIRSYIGRDNSWYLTKEDIVAGNILQQDNIADLLNYPDVPQSIQSVWNFQQVDEFTRNFTPPAGLTDTTDLVSEGYEFEVIANVTSNWRILFNAAQQEVKRSNSAAAFQAYVDSRQPDILPFFDFPATAATVGTIGSNFDRDTLQPLATITRQDGLKITDEIREWRFNAITNYTFDESFAKGFNIGGAFRWQDEISVGSPILNDPVLGFVSDVANPIFGPSESAVDAWVGYEKQLGDLTLYVTLRGRNLFGGDDLIPVRSNPDGSFPTMRIPAERRWEIETTLRF